MIATLRRLRNDTSGLALLEFAFTLPLVVAIGGWGTELSFLALTNLRISQYALNLADNASRVGLAGTGGVTSLREADINDVFQGTRIDSKGINLTTYGRVTLSSLENVQQSYDIAPVQRIHWQRCMGLMSGSGYDSSYPKTAPFVSNTAGSDATVGNAGVTASSGMGDAGKMVTALSGNGVMFVEINYRYKPVFGSMFVSQQVIHYTASFIVRDNRDYSRIYNPTPTASAATCDKHAA